MGTAHLDGEPTNSCRLDWLSVSLFSASDALQREHLAYFLHISDTIAPGADYTEGGGRRFFANSLICSESGVQVRWTEPSGGGNNSGYLNADLTGTAFKYLDKDIRAAIYLDIAEMEGFRQATRVDSQRTILEPEATAEEIHRMVRRRQVWVPRYDSYGQLGQVDSKGDAVKGASVCWGSEHSATRCMTYNKALEDKWEGLEAVRHEVRSRKQPARDLFKALIAELRDPSSLDDRSPEARFVQSVLSKHMTYLDTSRFARIQDKADWPDNWASDSQPAPFWQQVLEGEPLELKTTWRVTKALEDSHAAMKQQYGRKDAMWVLWQVYGLQKPLDEVLRESLDQSVVRLRDEDLQELLRLVPKKHHRKLKRDWPEWRAAAAHNVEGEARQTYG